MRVVRRRVRNLRKPWQPPELTPPASLPQSQVKHSTTEGAQNQLGVGVDPDGKGAAAYTPAHQQSAVARYLEPAARIAAGQRSAGGNNRDFIREGNLPTMSMTGKAHIESMLIQQEQPVRRMRKK